MSLTQIFSHPKNGFSACHFLFGYGKCDRLHGHNYTVKVDISYNDQHAIEPIDFRVVNKGIQKELGLLDQKILVPKNSPVVQITSVLNDQNWQITVGKKKYSFPKQDVVILEGIDLTTAENLARYLYFRLRDWLEQHFLGKISTMRVKVEENLGNEASYSIQDELAKDLSPNVYQSP